MTRDRTCRPARQALARAAQFSAQFSGVGPLVASEPASVCTTARRGGGLPASAGCCARARASLLPASAGAGLRRVRSVPSAAAFTGLRSSALPLVATRALPRAGVAISPTVPRYGRFTARFPSMISFGLLGGGEGVCVKGSPIQKHWKPVFGAGRELGRVPSTLRVSPLINGYSSESCGVAGSGRERALRALSLSVARVSGLAVVVVASPLRFPLSRSSPPVPKPGRAGVFLKPPSGSRRGRLAARCRYHCYPHFTEEDTEASGWNDTAGESPSRAPNHSAFGWELNLGFPAPEWNPAGPGRGSRVLRVCECTTETRRRAFLSRRPTPSPDGGGSEAGGGWKQGVLCPCMMTERVEDRCLCPSGNRQLRHRFPV